MSKVFKYVLAAAGLALATQAMAQVTFYEEEDFAGRSFTARRAVTDFERAGFNNISYSFTVANGRWEICDDAGFQGNCLVLRPGRYNSAADIGLNEGVSSVRPISQNARVAESRYAQPNIGSKITFYEREGFAGRTFSTSEQVENFERVGFNDRASSAIVTGSGWVVCEQERFQGKCATLRPGRYASLGEMDMDNRISSVRMVNSTARNDLAYAANQPVPVAVSQVTFYDRENFQGTSMTTEKPIENFARVGFNDRASSMIVVGNRWEVCENDRFNGRCVQLAPGRYPDLNSMQMNNGISSLRIAGANPRGEADRDRQPEPMYGYDNRRRNNERTYEAQVTAVRAVVGTPEQRCWVEREQVAPEKGPANVGGALIGAVIGGVLGHQVGNGRGNDLATVGGAVAGGVIGANVGRDGQAAATRDVKRCESVSGPVKADFYDVTYTFRGQEHRMQMTTPPGNTVTVNEQGEPRA